MATTPPAAGYPLYTDGTAVYTSFDGGKTLISVGSVGGGAVTGQAAALARAQALLGPSIDTTIGYDMIDDQWWRTVVTVGVTSASVVDRGGVLAMTAGNGASTGSFVLAPHGSTTTWISNARTDKFHIICRMKVATTVDGQANEYFGFNSVSGSNPRIEFGVLGVLSATNYYVLITNDSGVQTAAATAATVDNNYHLFEIIGDTTNLTFFIDGLQVAQYPVSDTGVNPVTPILTVSSNTGTVQTMKVDYLWVSTAHSTL